MTQGDVMFHVLEPSAFQKYSTTTMLNLSSILYFVNDNDVGVLAESLHLMMDHLWILHLTHMNVIFGILESHVFKKYSTFWVF